MATQTLVRTLPAGVHATKAPPVREYPEAGSQSFKTGDLLILSSGKVAIAMAPSASATLGDAVLILGMALQDAAGVTDTPVKVMIFDDDTTLTLPFQGAPTAVANNGNSYEIRNFTGNIWTVVAEQSVGEMKVYQIGVNPKFPAGDTNGWVDVKFLKGELAFG